MDEHDVQVPADFQYRTASSTERQPLLNDHAKDPFVVVFSGSDDPLDPMNMAPWRKWLCAIILGLMTFTVTFSSSIFSAAVNVTAEEFGVSVQTMALATSLFIIGLAAGPVLMGPSSELFGRKTPLFIAYVIFIVSQIPVGLAQNAYTVLIFRLVGGVAASGSSAIVGGYLADFFPPVQLGVAIAIYSATTLIGPSVGGIVGGIVVQSSLGWRWIVWLTMIQGLVFGSIGFLILPETYVPVVLTRKAKHLRLTTGEWALHSKLEEVPVDFTKFVMIYLSRPFLMLCLEPILLFMTLYISFTLGTIYLLFVVRIIPDSFLSLLL
jgi:DHA1 family multidrug resistance protein-like MFS transporter